MARPPPPPYEARDEYQDPVLNRLISGLSDLQVSALSSPRAPRSPPPRAPPPRTPSPTPTRLYAFSSPTRSGHTTEWSEAAHHTQGSPQGHARAIIKPRKKSRRKSNAYVVFFGVVPKVYDHWYGPNQAHEQVSGVPGSVSKGYGTRPEAEAAFAYAVARNWTGVRRRRYSSPPTPPSAIFTLPVPMSSLDPSPNPLHGSSDAPIRTWYVVYAGITPGIYLSHLESSLNTAGLSCAAHDAATSLSEAQRRWNEAQSDGRVKCLTHRYLSES